MPGDLVPKGEADIMLQAVLRIASDPNVPVDRVEAALRIGRDLEADHARKLFNASFSAMKPDLPEIHKRGIVFNKAGKEQWKYARYDDLHRALKPILRKHGFGTTFTYEEPGPGRLTCVLELLHDGGASKFYRWTLPWAGENNYVTNLQNAAAAKTFAKRQVLIDALDILTADVDKDGAAFTPPQPISEDEARKIEDRVVACEERESGFTARFLKWLRTEMPGVEGIRDLTQGVQRDSVVMMLKGKMAGLGIE